MSKSNVIVSGGEKVIAAVICLAGFAMLLSHAVIVSAAGEIGFVMVLFSLLVSCFIWPRFSLCLLLMSIVMQNLCLSLVVKMIDDAERFQLFQATNFFIPLVIFVYAAGYVFYKRHMLEPDIRKILYWGTAFAAVVVLYTIYGMSQSTFKSAMIYFRVYFYGYMAFVIGISYGLRIKMEFIKAAFYVVGVAIVAYGIIEFCFPFELYSLLNANEFLRLKFSFFTDGERSRDIAELIETSTRSYLNFSGQFQLDLRLLRIMGPNFHPISYGYSLAFFGLMALMAGHVCLFSIALVPLFLAASKGSIVLVFFCAIFIAVYRTTGNIKLLKLSVGGLLTLYILAVLIYGYYSKDYHFVGLMGGFKGFLSKPYGYGIGVGGNMSALGASSAKDMVAFQNYGAAFAVESALGVLLYQVGIFITIFFVYWFLFVKKLFFIAAPVGGNKKEIGRNIIVPVGLCVMLTGAIFQEEAFSPPGTGLWMLIGGMMLTSRKDNFIRRPHVTV